jgi:SAM-dependent methyltransferase
LGRALESVRTVAGSAENVGFPDSSFDAVIYVASLQFIERYKEAIKQTVRVLRAGGKLLIMLLNLESDFFKERTRNPASYINKIRHTDLSEIERAVAEHLPIETEYFLGIKGTRIFQSGDPNVASLYVINGTCETRGEIHEWPDRPDFSRQALDVSCVRVHITVCCVRCERGIYSDNALGRRRYGD